MSNDKYQLDYLLTFSLAFLLENGALYHIAHSVALLEYLVTLYFKPELKRHAYVSLIGELPGFILWWDAHVFNAWQNTCQASHLLCQDKS